MTWKRGEAKRKASATIALRGIDFGISSSLYPSTKDCPFGTGAGVKRVPSPEKLAGYSFGMS